MHVAGSLRMDATFFTNRAFHRSLPVRRCGRVQLSFVTVTFNICCRSRWAQYTEVSISKVRLASEAGLDLRRSFSDALDNAAPSDLLTLVSFLLPAALI